jgi:hypothetical protein
MKKSLLIILAALTFQVLTAGNFAIDPDELLQKADEYATQMAEATCEQNSDDLEKIANEVEAYVQNLDENELKQFQERFQSTFLEKASSCLDKLFKEALEDAMDESMEEATEVEESVDDGLDP